MNITFNTTLFLATLLSVFGSSGGEPIPVPYKPPRPVQFQAGVTAVVRLDLQYDYYVHEINWEIKDGPDTLYSGPDPEKPVDPYDLRSTRWEDFPTGSYVFVIYDSYGDGLSSPEMEGYYKIFQETPTGDQLLVEGGMNFTNIETSNFVVRGLGDIGDDLPLHGFECIPLPSDDYACYYTEKSPYPFEQIPSSLLAVCKNDTFLEPTPENCACGVYVGDPSQPWTTDECSSCRFLESPPDGEWQITYDCSNLLEGDCIGLDEDGECMGSCKDDINTSFNVSDDETGDCKWLGTNRASHGHLCSFSDVAATCPVTCDACTKVHMGEKCNEKGDALVYINSAAEYQTCDWLGNNMGRYGYACDQIDIASECPVTCSFGDC